MSTPTATQTQPNWSNLPKKVLSGIARHLDWRTDLPKARAVCPTWRARLPKNPPIISTSKFVIAITPSESLMLAPSHYYFLSPLSKTKTQLPWLIRVFQKKNNTNTYTLLNPFNQTKYFFTTPSISTSLSLLSCNFLELSTTYTLMDDLARRCSKKVVGGWALDAPFRFSILAQIIIKNNPHPHIFFWKLGDELMTQVKDPKSNTPLKIVDIAYYNKKFYSFDSSRWEVGVIDPLNVTTERVEMEFHPAPDILLFNDAEGRYMVTFNGSPFFLGDVFLVPTSVGLYMVFEVGDVDEYEKARVLVYKMRESGVDGKGKPTWENADTLDDQVFFIGSETAFSLPHASVNLPQWKPNSICFFTHRGGLAMDGYDKDMGMVLPKGVEILESITYTAYWKYLSVCVMGEDEKGVIPFEELPMDVFTGLFFPPPPWVKWRCPYLGGLQVKFDKLVLGAGGRLGDMLADVDSGSDESDEYYDDL